MTDERKNRPLWIFKVTVSFLRVAQAGGGANLGSFGYSLFLSLNSSATWLLRPPRLAILLSIGHFTINFSCPTQLTLGLLFILFSHLKRGGVNKYFMSDLGGSLLLWVDQV